MTTKKFRKPITHATRACAEDCFFANLLSHMMRFLVTLGIIQEM